MPKVPYEQLPRELRILSKENYERMLAERPQWNDMFERDNDGVFVSTGNLLNRLRDDRTPMTVNEHIMANHLSHGMNEMHEKHGNFIGLKNTVTRDDWGPREQSFTLCSTHFPAIQDYFNHGGTHRRTRIGHWFGFTRRHGYLSQKNFEENSGNISDITRALSNREAQERQWTAEKEEKIREQQEQARRVQLEAQFASHRRNLEFRTAEFNRALASMKSESAETRDELTKEFDQQSANIRTDLTQQHQSQLADRDSEHARRSREYQEQLQSVTDSLQRQAVELSGVRAEIASQRLTQEDQLAARRLEESERRQEMEVLQRNLSRRMRIHPSHGAGNLHFVGMNQGDKQGRVFGILADGGRRYVKSRVSFNDHGKMTYSTEDEEKIPDFNLRMTSLPRSPKRRGKK